MAKKRSELPHLYYPRFDTVRIINSHLGGGGGTPSVPATREFLTTLNSSSGATTYNFSSPLGTPRSNRTVVICVGTRKTGGGLCEITSCSIGGVPASSVVQRASSPSGTVNYAGIMQANVPSGTTGDISITFSLPVLRCGVHVYDITGELHQFDSSIDDAPFVSLDVPSDGLVIGVMSVASSQSFDWTGMTEDATQLVSGASRVASASALYPVGESGKSLGLTRNAGSWSGVVGSFASWGPR